ncbi:MAG: hypothetical protein WBI07_18305 [Mobilitalea sp.]
MGQLQLKDIYFGKIDGYNEYLEYGQELFKGLFFEFPNIDINRLLNGSTYYIFGNKGTGKTMLLKYLESTVLETSATNFTEFIRFKKDINEDDRNQIKRASLPTNSFEEIIESEIPTDSTVDCTLAWQVYLIKVIVLRIEKTEFGVFDRTDDNWKKLTTLISAMYGTTEQNPIQKILPKMKRGNIELDIAKIAKTTIEFEWVDAKQGIVSFSTLGKQIIDLYSSLIPLDNNIYVFVDELELSFKQSKKYQRDVTLIRDLVFAIEYLCDLNRTHLFNVYIIAAIRNEVYKSISSKGTEINKTTHDFGYTISWEQKGGNIKNHPLLQMLEKRIHYSEQIKGYNKTIDIWKDYFIPYVGNGKVDAPNYVLDLTWYKPRDIIRLFTIMQFLKGNKNTIDQETFDTVTKQYSEESWREFEEVLTVKYPDAEVDGIKKALTGISLPFMIKDFVAQIEGKSEVFEEVDLLIKNNRKPAQILRDLYDIGVIGNYGGNSRFVFKGDDDIDPLSPLTIHYPLIRFFKASIKAFEKNRYIK